jgi:hypothetical protein
MMKLEKCIWGFLWLLCIVVIGHELKFFLQSDLPQRWIMLSWHLGDWLINYQGGFIRRGLIGQIFFILSDFGISLKWAVFSLHTVLYFTVFWLIFSLYRMKERGVEWYIILLSPVFLTFPFHDFLGNSRKENLLFVVFLWFLTIFSKKAITFLKLVALLLAYAFGVLSHELMSFAVPFFLYVLLRAYELGDLDKKNAVGFGLAFVTVAAVGIVIAIIFHGDLSQSIQICLSVIDRGIAPHICDGAIDYLKSSRSDGLKDMMSVFPDYQFVYPILFFLSLIPMFLTSWFQDKRNIGFFILTLVCLLPLFIVATDWGRWIYILMFMWFAVLLAESVRVPIVIKQVPMWFLVLYLSTWGMPHHLNAFDQRAGLLGEVFKGIESAVRNL